MTDVRLGGYPAKKCPRVTHNLNAPGTPAPLDVSADVQQLFDDGNEFESAVTSQMLTALGDAALYIDEEALGWDRSRQATLEAMQRGVPVIINGRLPDVDGRVGAPDVLVRVDGGYLPVDIKHHKTFGAQKTRMLTFAALTDPSQRIGLEGRSGDGSHRTEDCLQLAHYTRMLEGLAFHPGDSDGAIWGGIIGTSDFTELTGSSLGVTWYDLAAPYEQTYSASAPGNRKKRSPLERYDHEIAFRFEVARAAREGRELVTPIGTDECWTCVWQEHCATVVGEDDASFALTTGRLSAREWLFLRRHGGDTIEGLAVLDAAPLLDEFKSHAVGKQSVEARLRNTIERARMIRDDIDLEPYASWPEVPSADLEIDFDIETDLDQRIYQWGLQIRTGQELSSARYEPVVLFGPLDDAGEQRLADAFADKLEALISAAVGRGETVAIYHWTSVERSRTSRFPRVKAILDAHAFDLCAWMREQFRMRGSYSIKDVAKLFDFSWGLDDAGGFASMQKIEAARAGDEAAREWCLVYNRADVAAQAAIRDGLRAR